MASSRRRLRAQQVDKAIESSAGPSAWATLAGNDIPLGHSQTSCGRAARHEVQPTADLLPNWAASAREAGSTGWVLLPGKRRDAIPSDLVQQDDPKDHRKELGIPPRKISDEIGAAPGVRAGQQEGAQDSGRGHCQPSPATSTWCTLMATSFPIHRGGPHTPPAKSACSAWCPSRANHFAQNPMDGASAHRAPAPLLVDWPLNKAADKQPLAPALPNKGIHAVSAVIVSTARTALCKSWKGSFNMTHGATLAGHVVRHAVTACGSMRRGGRRAHGLREPGRRDGYETSAARLR